MDMNTKVIGFLDGEVEDMKEIYSQEKTEYM